MSDSPTPIKVSRRIVRGQKTLKHFRSNILTQPHLPDAPALVTLLTDLRHTAAKGGIQFEDCLKQSLTDFNEEV